MKSNIMQRNKRRFKDNPLEKRFAEEWENRNNLSGRGHTTLDYLLAEDNNRPNGEVTDRDREVAGVLIQWLGSHVGQCFLSDVLEIDIRKLIKSKYLIFQIFNINKYMNE